MVSPRPRILIVDDERGILDLLAAALELDGLDAEVRTEADGRVAITRLAMEKFALVVSDFRMPGVDGIDVLSAARRSNPAGKRVLFTGYNEVPATVERVVEAKVDMVLHKPIAPDEFLATVRRLLDLTRSAPR